MSTVSNARKPRLAAAATLIALVLLPVAAGTAASAMADGALNAGAQSDQTHV